MYIQAAGEVICYLTSNAKLSSSDMLVYFSPQVNVVYLTVKPYVWVDMMDD